MPREMMVMAALVTLYCLWILLPLVPAVLIYRLFPNTSVAVSGPLAQLTVRASGAFAAYLIVFACSYPVTTRFEQTVDGFERPFWTIKGRIKLVDANGAEVLSDPLLEKMSVKTVPDPITVESYLVRVNVPETEDFPLLILDIPDFGRQVIDLRSPDAGITFDHYHKTINITAPITIQERPSKAVALGLQPGGASQPYGLTVGTRPVRQ
jgi:hypothetical protein